MVYVIIIVGVLLGIVAVAAAVALLGRRRIAKKEEQRRSALRLFAGQRAELPARFLEAAAATGKPRGLRWKAVELSGAPLFATDPSGVLYALAGATISFEAVEGGAMEDVEAVGNLRSATAVFVHRDGEWTTEGRVIFNLEPAEAIARFDGALQEYPSPLRGEVR
jgi:type II secretory pathway pseudopilin PulG